jgi:hypothetical protein
MKAIKPFTVKPEKVKYPLAESFLKILTDGKSDVHDIFRILFSILELEELDAVLKRYKKIWSGKDSHFGKIGKTEWYAAFHKEVRQIDFFSLCYRKRHLELLTEKEQSEYTFLINKVTKEGYNKKGETMLFNDEYRRFLSLSEKKRAENREVSIGGKLDSILWLFIHVDEDDILKTSMEKLFKGK